MAAKKVSAKAKAKSNRVLVTSALPYVNNVPHLGNLVGSVLGADAFARFKRLEGNEVLFILGTDEHGTTAEAKAIEEHLTPRQLVDKYFLIHKAIYDWFNASYDCLGRTSSKENAEITKHIFLKLHENGFLVERTEEQMYSEKSKKFLSGDVFDYILNSSQKNTQSVNGLVTEPVKGQIYIGLENSNFKKPVYIWLEVISLLDNIEYYKISRKIQCWNIEFSKPLQASSLTMAKNYTIEKVNSNVLILNPVEAFQRIEFSKLK